MRLKSKHEKLELRNVLMNGQGPALAIGIENGIISYISVPQDERHVIDGQGLIAVPGIVDGHVHLRFPGEDHKEDWPHAQRAAFRGGVTTVCDMPNNAPGFAVVTPESYHYKLQRIGQQTINYRLWYGALPNGDRMMPKIKALPCFVGVKMYMEHSTGGLLLAQRSDQYEWCRRAAEADVLVGAHVGNQEMIDKNRQMIVSPQIADHCVIRDAQVELSGGLQSLEIGEQTGCRLHIMHVSIPELAQAIKEAKQRGVRVTCEVCLHHLLLNAQHLLLPRAGRYKMNPPLRTMEQLTRLWGFIDDGTIDVIGTDHAPHTLKEKSVAGYDQVPSGIPGLQEMVPLLLDRVAQGKMSWNRFIDLTSRNAAQILGLHGKGHLVPGYDADITLLDLNEETVFSDQDALSKCGWTAYDGMCVKGAVKMTIARGQVVFNGLEDTN